MDKIQGKTIGVVINELDTEVTLNCHNCTTVLLNHIPYILTLLFKHPQTLREASLASKVTGKKLAATLTNKAKSLLTVEIEIVEPATRSNSRKRQSSKGECSKSKRIEVLPEVREVDKEIDGVYIDNNEYTVGTTIKRAAIDLHKKLQQGAAMTPRQTKIMTNGLSSILDLSDDSFASQMSLFSSSDWSSISEYFGSVLKLSPTALSDKIKDNLIIIYSTLRLPNTSALRAAIIYYFQQKDIQLTNFEYSFMRDTYYWLPSKLPSFMFGFPPVYDQGASTTSIAQSSSK